MCFIQLVGDKWRELGSERERKGEGSLHATSCMRREKREDAGFPKRRQLGEIQKSSQ